MTEPTVPASGPRAQAIAAGAPRYSTGKPCRNGHVAERYTLDGDCVVCRHDRQMAERTQIMAIRAAKVPQQTREPKA